MSSYLEDKAVFMQMNGGDSMPRFEWTGVELCVTAMLQLMLVWLAYRQDQLSRPSLISISAYAIFFGLAFGSVLAFMSPREAGRSGLNPKVFFYGLLPPIILEAGFNMKKRGFFSNFSTILLLAVMGTLIATFVTGGAILLIGRMGLIIKLTSAEAFLYGSLISAIDPVAVLSIFKKCDTPPLLFNLVFGESVLNDGVAIVVYTLLQNIVRSGSNEFSLGVAVKVIFDVACIGLGSVLMAALVCFASAFFLKHANENLKELPTIEISIILLSAYLSYVLSDLAGLSGIVSLFFSGVLMSHYHLYSISTASATALIHLLSTLAFLAENFIFLYLGVSVVAYSGSFNWDWGFVVVNLLVCLLARAANVFPLCWLANIGRKEKIPFSYRILIWFSGLRGAIAFALALNVWTPDPTHSGAIKSTTLFTVMFTTLVFGMGTIPLLDYLDLSKRGKIHLSDISADEMQSFLTKEEQDNANHTLIPMDHDSKHDSQQPQRGYIHSTWDRLDELYFKPLFGGNPRSTQQHRKDPHRSHIVLTTTATKAPLLASNGQLSIHHLQTPPTPPLEY